MPYTVKRYGGQVNSALEAAITYVFKLQEVADTCVVWYGLVSPRNGFLSWYQSTNSFTMFLSPATLFIWLDTTIYISHVNPVLGTGTNVAKHVYLKYIIHFFPFFKTLFFTSIDANTLEELMGKFRNWKPLQCLGWPNFVSSFRGIHYYNLPLSMVGNLPHEHWNRLKSRNNHTVLATYQMPYSGHSR